MRPRVERLPEAQRQALARARRIQGVWLFALGTITVAVYFSLGNSQAMKTAWIEDLLSFVPPIAFLIASWIEGWAPNDRFPFGFIRVTSIAYLVSAVALAGVGKRILWLDRLRLRGPNGARDEFLLAATVQNLRKLAKLIPDATAPA
jgi:divalent metal cation (Fe/Co/Zn/Cd) transporter